MRPCDPESPRVTHRFASNKGQTIPIPSDDCSGIPGSDGNIAVEYHSQRKVTGLSVTECYITL
eukprot:1355297-Amorphochlora_amoeboformis.AAC.1